MISELKDINPKSWLCPYQKTSVFYLLKMGLFYHFLGMILMYAGSFLVTSVISDYEIPQISVSLSLALSAGVLEESVFFGIPFYITGNPIVLLGTGIIWSISHLFNSGVFSFETLAYGGFLFSIPHIFFSIRTWISKKGWFAILFHSGWNATVLSVYCIAGLRMCTALNDTFDVINMVIAGSSGMIVYLAYKNKQQPVNKLLYAIPTGIIIFAMTVFLMDYSFLNS